MAHNNSMQIEYLPLKDLREFEHKVRKPGKKQLAKTVQMIQSFGFTVPLIVDSEGRVVVGQHLFFAAQELHMEEVAVIRIEHLDEVQLRLYRIAWDRISEEAEWDQQALKKEFAALSLLMPEIDLTLTGFEMAEIDIIIDLDQNSVTTEDEVPLAVSGPTLARTGDTFILGNHRLHCGDSLQEESYKAVLKEEKAHAAFLDAPYNVPIKGNVCGKGAIQHEEFAMASGEMSQEEFTKFLCAIFVLIGQHSIEGSVQYSCIDWRHMQEMQTAVESAQFTLMNVCVWVKDNGGMGSFYRSRHELVFVLKRGEGKYTNNIELGKHGRYRTNVWEYAGVNTMRAGRLEELAMHPTVKPVAMVADAIKDCTKRGDIVLDTFGGSGTTLIACEKMGRKARLIEIDPKYCDVTIRRWQALTGRDAMLESTGQRFDDIAPSVPETSGVAINQEAAHE